MIIKHKESIEIKMLKENQKKAELSNHRKAWKVHKKEGTST